MEGIVARKTQYGSTKYAVLTRWDILLRSIREGYLPIEDKSRLATELAFYDEYNAK